MNLIPKNRTFRDIPGEEIETVEGEVIDITPGTSASEREKTGIEFKEKAGVIATLGTVAAGLFKLFMVFSEWKPTETSEGKRKKRFRRRKG